MTADFNDRNAVYNLLRLVKEQNTAIHELRLLLGAVTWLVTRGDAEKTRELNEMIFRIDHGKPLDNEREEQWRAWLMSTQREVEQGRAEIPS
jgi:hypothetical protein